MQSVDHKCPNCNAVLKYNPKGKNWKCEYCGSAFKKEDIAKNEEKFEKTKVKKQNVEMDEYECQNCGAKIVADQNTAATFCVYCRNTAILKSRLTDEFAPSKVIPFAKTKEDAVAAFKKVCRGKLFIPKEFALERNINEIKGVYIPFWLSSYETSCHITGNGTRITTWTTGDKIYTKTDVYSVDRSAEYTFNNIPVDGSKRFDDAIMNSVEPFNYAELTDFSPSYLSGFLAEKYDVPKEEATVFAKDRAKTSSIDSLYRTVNYTNFVPKTKDVNFTKEESDYVLLPVWMVNVKYNGKMYPFAMNGQTGKMIGDIPWSKGKAFMWFGIVFVIAFILLMLVTYML